MAETVFWGPLSNLTPGTGWGQPVRVHRTSAGSSAAYSAWDGRRTTWYNCFDASQIPAGATIDGVEVIFTGTSGSNGFGTAGSTGGGESSDINVRMYNGTSYSSIVHTSSHRGANNYYSGTIGGPTDLHGLTWAEADQASFGFDVECNNFVATPVVVCVRGCGLKVYYTPSGGGGGDPIPGVQAMHQTAPAATQSIHGVSVDAIQSINQIG